MKEKLKYIKFSDIKPMGWLHTQMQGDLTNGFVGHLDELVPDLIIKDDIYGENRLTKEVKKKDVGSYTLDDPKVEVAFLWWNSETQSNWLDGLVRNAFLTEDKEFIEKSKAYVKRMLSYQDEDVYLGIYSRDLRFAFSSENGELWAQSSLFRVLLGYFEATGELEALKAVESAMSVIMKAYPINESTPFKGEEMGHGVCHGLTITDSLERLYQITGNKEYLNYAEWLYEDYCKYILCEDDIQTQNLLDKKNKFKGHGAHTYEHLRSLAIAYYSSGDSNLKQALDNYMDKLDTCLTPSGGPISDEWISGRIADTTNTGYEYCSIHELLDSYTFILQKSGEMQFADRIEWLLYNAGQGARHPNDSSIAYLKTDNSYAMEGAFQEDQLNDSDKVQLRYMYSPTHQKTAVCCVPNAGRIFPYFVRSMFMSDEDGIVAALYGPCKLITKIKDNRVEIEQETNYPFDFNIKFRIKVEEPTDFRITLRKPSWATNSIVVSKNAILEENSDRIVLQKQWINDDEINITFDADVKETIDNQGDYYISRGPILYCLPLKHKEEVAENFGVGVFRETKYSSDEKMPTNLYFTNDSLKSARLVTNEFDEKNSWQNCHYLKVNLFNSKTNRLEEVNFFPLGSTILRKVTFSKHF